MKSEKAIIGTHVCQAVLSFSLCKLPKGSLAICEGCGTNNTRGHNLPSLTYLKHGTIELTFRPVFITLKLY